MPRASGDIMGRRQKTMRAWLTQHIWQITAFSALLIAVALAAASVLLVRMPADYFIRPPVISHSGPATIRALRRGAKNVLATIVAIVGVLMSLPLVPGPGLLLLLIALSLADFPGKRRLELRIVANPLVLRPVNKIRTFSGRRPLLLPDRQGPAARTGR
jgi:hypothetical protein